MVGVTLSSAAMTNKTIATRLSELKQQIANCIDSGNITWQYRAEAELVELMKLAPNGRGFDAGTNIETATNYELLFSTSFHHQNQNGLYVGWTHHRVLVKAVFGGFILRVTGTDKDEILKHIGAVFYKWLSTEIKVHATKQIEQREREATTKPPRVLEYTPHATAESRELPALEHKPTRTRKRLT